MLQLAILEERLELGLIVADADPDLSHVQTTGTRQ